MDKIPITEQSSCITEDIDVASTSEMVQQLYQCDRQIFTGYNQWQSLYEYCDQIEIVVNEAANILQADDSCIVMTGCGTSGRMGFLTALSFNHILKRDFNCEPRFRYLLAGGDEALFVSKELIEDDPKAGVDDLLKICKDKDRVLMIGITCGLSAPYVAGQLEYAFQHPGKFYPVLLGFNPVDLARDIPVENWDKTFMDVTKTFQKSKCGAILTPVYGPEPITGSSRMKGGTTTKIILDALFTCAVMRTSQAKKSVLVRDIINSYEHIQNEVFKNNKIAKGIELCGVSLQNNGHIYYVSESNVGVLGLIDASECPPTFGANVDDVRGFIRNSYAAIDTNERDCSTFLDISLSYFKDNILPRLSTFDTVCILQKCDPLEIDIRASKAQVLRIAIDSPLLEGAGKEHVISVNLAMGSITDILGEEVSSFMRPFFREIATKWICNCLTTGAHILKGKVYKNYMIDVRVRNDKLYRRAIRIIEKFAEVSEPEAESCLLRAIYATDNLDAMILEKAISRHIEKATYMEMVVPIAIILAKGTCDVGSAKTILQQHPVIRQAVAQIPR